MTANCLSQGLKISNNFYGFDLYLKEKLVNFYSKYPVGARVGMVTLGAFSGLIKTFAFPILSLIGVILLPIKAAHAKSQGNLPKAVAYMDGAGFCLLGLVASVAFILVTGHHIPLVWSFTAFGGFAVISMSFHVYKMAKEPQVNENKLA